LNWKEAFYYYYGKYSVNIVTNCEYFIVNHSPL